MSASSLGFTESKDVLIPDGTLHTIAVKSAAIATSFTSAVPHSLTVASSEIDPFRAINEVALTVPLTELALLQPGHLHAAKTIYVFSLAPELSSDPTLVLSIYLDGNQSRPSWLSAGDELQIILKYTESTLTLSMQHNHDDFSGVSNVSTTHDYSRTFIFDGEKFVFSLEIG